MKAITEFYTVFAMGFTATVLMGVVYIWAAS